MDDKQKFDLGFEIISGMHAEIRNHDIEWGRLETLDGLSVDPECPDEYMESHLRSIELANIRINKQADFMANVVLTKLSEMGFELKKK